MDKAMFEYIKAAVELGDVYFVNDDGKTINVRAVFVDRDGQIWFSDDEQNLIKKR